MGKRNTAWAAMVMCAVAALLVAACGGDSSEAEDDTATPSTSAATEQATTTSAAAPTTTTVPSVTTTTLASGGCGLAEGVVVIYESVNPTGENWVDPASEVLAPLGLSPEETEAVVCETYEALTSGSDPTEVMDGLLAQLGYSGVEGSVNSSGAVQYSLSAADCGRASAVMRIAWGVDNAVNGHPAISAEPGWFRNFIGVCDG